MHTARRTHRAREEQPLNEDEEEEVEEAEHSSGLGLRGRGDWGLAAHRVDHGGVDLDLWLDPALPRPAAPLRCAVMRERRVSWFVSLLACACAQAPSSHARRVRSLTMRDSSSSTEVSSACAPLALLPCQRPDNLRFSTSGWLFFWPLGGHHEGHGLPALAILWCQNRIPWKRCTRGVSEPPRGGVPLLRA